MKILNLFFLLFIFSCLDTLSAQYPEGIVIDSRNIAIGNFTPNPHVSMHVRNEWGQIAIERGDGNVGGASIYLSTFHPDSSSWSPESLIASWRISSALATGNFSILHENDNNIGGGGYPVFFIDDDNYNIGIETDTPRSKLHIKMAMFIWKK